MGSDEDQYEPAAPAKPSSSASLVSEQDQQQRQQKSKTAKPWNTKNFREEYAIYKNRLQDQDFSVAEYPDPLAPPPPHPKQYPKGTDAELEGKLLRLIAEIKAGQHGE
ncbi:853d6258-73e7-4e7f-9a64-89ff3d4e3b50 [Thermothielavioides terrestris]|uniref:853d6258-73e7-4e7f-9a64-89ff3d4e3b50 n=1 Tax=Thermothielavioides terrestris TaxID=2587410 RepID=A0A446B717_9PEZI|nr:853d6258-73e7-4e7f-9a64-89ff3d4e3b50 [Thermothielavioides terrestris]